MYKLLSERIKNKEDEPEVYIYDVFPEAFRNQVFYIIKDILDKYEESKPWDYLHNAFAREIGVKQLGRYQTEGSISYGRGNLEFFISTSDEAQFLDMIDYVFYIINAKFREIRPKYNPIDMNNPIDIAIKELNYRFKQHNLGYEFTNGEIIRIDNKLLHQEVIKPALKLLFEEGFDGAEEEFRKAFEYRRKGDNKNAILEAGKAFESTMKTICEKEEYVYDKAKDTAKTLIAILEKNNYYPTYMSTYMTSLRTTLETGLPVVRNKNSGHGQGSTVIPIPTEFTEYALNLAASNIVLLVGIYKGRRQ